MTAVRFSSISASPRVLELFKPSCSLFDSNVLPKLFIAVADRMHRQPLNRAGEPFPSASSCGTVSSARRFFLEVFLLPFEGAVSLPRPSCG